MREDRFFKAALRHHIRAYCSCDSEPGQRFEENASELVPRMTCCEEFCADILSGLLSKESFNNGRPSDMMQIIVQTADLWSCGVILYSQVPFREAYDFISHFGQPPRILSLDSLLEY